jgi:hypothetical protein
VHVDENDIISLSSTLSIIIHPALEKYRELNCGDDKFVMIDSNDIPQHLWNAARAEQWRYVVDEMIYAFGVVKNYRYIVNYDAKRMDEGLRLFGKYYLNLW